MRGVTLGVTLLAAGAYLAYTNRSAAKAIDWKEVGTRVSEAAGPVLKHNLPFIAAFLVTGFSAFLAVVITAMRIYPNTDIKGKTSFVTDAYQQLSPSDKIKRALTLIFVGAAVGAGLGGAMMKGASTALQISSRYFKITTVALTLTGAGIGALFSAHIHRQKGPPK